MENYLKNQMTVKNSFQYFSIKRYAVDLKTSKLFSPQLRPFHRFYNAFQVFIIFLTKQLEQTRTDFQGI
jgi:hypothetical protein